MSTRSSTNQRSSIQDGSAHLFVPYDAGRTRSTSDDSKEPGAILRLGGYSSVEQAATDLTKFYPENHNAAEGGNNLTNAVGPSSGGYRGGILLSCDGRMLMRTGEKFYLQSVGDMDIDSNANMKIAATGTMNIESGDAMTIRTYNKKGITISADEGNADLTMTTAKKTERHIGETFTITDKNEYKLIKADTHTYRLGQTFALTCSDSWSVFFGSNISITAGIAISLNLSVSLALKATYDITLYLGKIDVGIQKIDICLWKGEFKDFKWSYKRQVFKASANKTELNATKNETTGVDATTTGVDTANSGVVANNGGVDSATNGINLVN
ncbi:hypothetical protein [Rhizobium sp. SL86]|uniref:hypothetical protein n=1 Tax=Rhizobium sp. SL86 TaxID=2995148 RepID=UPI002272E0B0|nr:hypothetical protein [Rhizobium sp. SL86]MCY1669074.1 hypothetical protein [Rhizobium sp. SL86]